MFRRASFWLTLAAILFCFLTLVSADAVETPEAGKTEAGKTEAAEASESVEAAEETFEGPSFVLTLDSTNFTENVAQHGFILVQFYAPWCGHCKNLVPEYEKAAAILSEHDPPIVLAKVDATNETNKELAAQFEVRSYPTMKILRNGGQVMQEYKGPRVADGMVEYLKRQRGPAAVEIKSADYINKLLGELKIVVVGVFSEFSGEPYENFTDVSEKMRSDYEFAYTSDAKILPYGESSVTGPIVRLFKPFDEHFVDFKDFNPEALVEFVEEASTPILAVYDGNPANHPFVVKFYNSPHAKAMMFVNFTLEGFDSMKSKYYEVAKQYNDQGISFLVGDANVSKAAFDYFGVKESQLPLIIIQTIDGRRYLKANLEADDIAPWVKDFKEGKLPVYIKSEPVPEENDEPVKVVVANTLEEMVFKSGKNVLLEFYAPWCGHCKKLAPILEEVAIHYESDDDVMIAKFDATANDVTNANFEVQGYPTMYFKSVDGNITSFEGNRTKEGIIEFIEKNRVKFVTEEIEPSVSLKDEL